MNSESQVGPPQLAVAGIPQAAGHLTLGDLAAAAGLALLLPVLPYAFEMLALRHMAPTAFGTLMALEPAIAVILGLLVLHQTLSAIQLVGVVLVVLAGTAAQRGARRHPQATDVHSDSTSSDSVDKRVSKDPPKCRRVSCAPSWR